MPYAKKKASFHRGGTVDVIIRPHKTEQGLFCEGYLLSHQKKKRGNHMQLIKEIQTNYLTAISANTERDRLCKRSDPAVLPEEITSRDFFRLSNNWRSI